MHLRDVATPDWWNLDEAGGLFIGGFPDGDNVGRHVGYIEIEALKVCGAAFLQAQYAFQLVAHFPIHFFIITINFAVHFFIKTINFSR